MTLTRKSTKAVRKSNLTQYQKRKEKRKKRSEDYENSRRFFSALKEVKDDGKV